MLKVYGSKVSYYTGKLEAYLRYKRQEYRRIPSIAHSKTIIEQTGALQMPVVEMANGRWMSDSTPIIRYLDTEVGGRSVYPADALQRFICLLIEDYADEWLWRPAMHYRWSYAHDRELLSSILVDELTAHLPLPRFLKRRAIQRRQRGGFVTGDGVTDQTRDHVEGTYRKSLALLQAIFSDRPYIMGAAPTIADFGLMAPMLRHFGQDPTPAEIMRTEAPAVYEWVYRVWNSTQDRAGNLVEGILEDLVPLLQEINATHCVQLQANAAAYAEDKKVFEVDIQGCRYRNLPVSRYRVWCLEQLHQRLAELTDANQVQLQQYLNDDGLKNLTTIPARGSGYDPDGLAPFNKAINVYGQGVPGT
jgi:glutathione S-transferase